MAVVDATRDDEKNESAMMQSLAHESHSLWKSRRGAAILTLTMPAWLTALVLIFLYIVFGPDLVRRLLVAAGASLAAGRFLIWAGATETGTAFEPWQLAAIMLYLDLMWAVVLTWHAETLFHFPWLGARLRSAVREGNLMLAANRWMRRSTVLVVTLFVMLPISSTGSIGGSLLGRLLGLSRTATFLSVLAGSLLGGLVMLIGAEALRPLLEQAGPAGTAGVIGLLILTGILIARRYRNSLTRQHPTETAGQ